MWAKKTNQRIMIKFPTEKQELLIPNTEVFVNPILGFEGRLKDGRSVIHKKQNEWVYVV